MRTYTKSKTKLDKTQGPCNICHAHTGKYYISECIAGAEIAIRKEK